MKTNIITLFSVLALAVAVRADSSVTLTGVHVCCGSCVKGITKAVSTVDGATAQAESKSDKVTITAKNAEDAKKAVAALGDAGYFGEGVTPGTAGAAKVKSATVKGPHLCCGKCVDAFNAAALSAPGVTKTDATKGAASVTVEGDFSPRDLLTALNKKGFNGKVK